MSWHDTKHEVLVLVVVTVLVLSLPALKCYCHAYNRNEHSTAYVADLDKIEAKRQ